MNTNRFARHRTRSIQAALCGTLGLLLSDTGCNLPEYRLFMNQIPLGTRHLSIAAYVPDAASPLVMDDSLQIDLNEVKEVVSATVNMPDSPQSGSKTSFAVVARDEWHCILATGSSEAVEASKTVADVYLSLRPLIAPPPGATAAAVTTACPSHGPSLAEVERFEQGLFGISEFYLKLKGWGFRPTDQINIYSSIEIDPGSCLGDNCNNRCVKMNHCPISNNPCYTNCRVLQERTKYISPVETNVYITREDINAGGGLKGRLVAPDPISALLNFPLTIELTRQGDSQPTTRVEHTPAAL